MILAAVLAENARLRAENARLRAALARALHPDGPPARLRAQPGGTA